MRLIDRAPSAIRALRIRYILPVLVALGLGLVASGHANGQTAPTATATPAPAATATPGKVLSSATNTKGFQYSVGVWGDLPYNDVQATSGVPNLIADMNASDIEFSVHDGDLKQGSGVPGSPSQADCADALYTRAAGYLNALQAPAFFTTGDNDWTDCDRGSNGGYNSLERLDFERKTFFSTPNSLGKRTLSADVQSDLTCLGFDGYVNPTLPKVNDNTTLDLNQQSNVKTKPAACVENRMWQYKGVEYVTLDVQGSCNNLCDKDPNATEWAARNLATEVWMQRAFAVAQANGSAGLVIISQADPGFDNSDGTRAPVRDAKTLLETDGAPDGFHEFLDTLRYQTTLFRKPVLYVHGDSHYFRIDKPLQNAKGQRLENFTRVETYGDHQENDNNDVHWVKILVDTNSRDVFAFQTQVVPANRLAVPNP